MKESNCQNQNNYLIALIKHFLLCLLLFYAIATVFPLYHSGDMMYEMSRTLHFYRLKGSLTSHTMQVWYERNWPLMML